MKWFINKVKNGDVSFYMFIISVAVILMVAIMGINLYRFCYRTIHEDFVKNQELYLKGKMDYHENDMRVLNDIVKQIGYNNVNTRFLPYMYFQIQKRCRNLLFAIFRSVDIIYANNVAKPLTPK